MSVCGSAAAGSAVAFGDFGEAFGDGAASSSDSSSSQATTGTFLQQSPPLSASWRSTLVLSSMASLLPAPSGISLITSSRSCRAPWASPSSDLARALRYLAFRFPVPGLRERAAEASRSASAHFFSLM